MKKVLSTIVWAMACMIVMTACNANADGTTTSKPIEDAAAAAVDKVKSDTKVDPLKDQKVEQEDNLPKTTMSFVGLEHDFGTIDEGDKVEHIFKFTNTGSEPLVLSKCKGSCGCTVPVCPKEPIAPGANGEIKVAFNSKGKKNKQTKKVTINANIDGGTETLTIKAQVTPEPVVEEGANG